MAWDWSKISVATRQMIIDKKVQDQVFSGSPVLARMRQRGIKLRGGDQLVQPVNLGKNTNVGSYSGYDLLSTDAMQTLGKAVWDWKQTYGAISVSGKDERINDSPERIFNLIEQEVDICSESLMDAMATMLYSDGSGNGGKDFTGFKRAIDDGTNYSTYASISRTTYPHWKAKYYANSGTPRAVTYKLLRRARSGAIFQGKKPNIGVTTVTIVDKIAELLQPAQQYTDVSEASMGFDNILFERIPVYADEYCPSGHLYFLREEDIFLVTHPSANFVFVPFQKPADQDAKVALILWMGELCVKRCRTHAVVKDLDES